MELLLDESSSAITLPVTKKKELEVDLEEEEGGRGELSFLSGANLNRWILRYEELDIKHQVRLKNWQIWFHMDITRLRVEVCTI